MELSAEELEKLLNAAWSKGFAKGAEDKPKAAIISPYSPPPYIAPSPYSISPSIISPYLTPPCPKCQEREKAEKEKEKK